jgi:hypothetical protein
LHALPANLYIPFVYFDGKAQFNGAELNAALLDGKSFQQIADSIAGGTSVLSSSVTADAGAIVSNIHRIGRQGSLFVKAVPEPARADPRVGLVRPPGCDVCGLIFAAEACIPTTGRTRGE